MALLERKAGLFLRLDSEPGVLERAAHLLALRRIDVAALGIEADGPAGYALLLSPDPAAVGRVLREAGIAADEAEFLLVALPNQAPVLAEALRRLGEAGVAVETVASAADGRLAFRTSDNARAAAVLSAM